MQRFKEVNNGNEGPTVLDTSWRKWL